MKKKEIKWFVLCFSGCLCAQSMLYGTSYERRSGAASFDGTTLSLTSEDPGVSLQLQFGNGLVTSTFEDPDEGTMVDANLEYEIEQISESVLKVAVDGDVLLFSRNANVGSLADYDSAGQIDRSGSWNFFYSGSLPQVSYEQSGQNGASFLDGTTLTLYSEDPGVTLTLAFSGGVVTSTFQSPDEGPFVDRDQSYFYERVGETGMWIRVAGDTLYFDENLKNGSLADYDQYGRIDSSGSWNFTYSGTIEFPDALAVKPGKMAGGRDSVYLQTPNGPDLLEDAGEINFDLELVEQPTVTSATLKVDGQVYDLTQNEGPAVFRTRYGYGTGEVYELYDVESSSDSDWSSYANGKGFEFSLTVGGNEYAYLHELPGEAALPTPPNLSVTDADSWKVDQDGYDYLEVPSADNYRVTWDAFDTSDSRDFIQVSLVELIGEDEEDIFEDIVLSASATDYEIDGSLLEKDKYYLFYIEFLNVTQSENPNGFTHAPASDSSEFILRSSASSVTALGFMLGNAEPVTVVSDPDGNPVAVQLGDKYQWNSTLDGVTLWSVSGSESEGDWDALTAKFSGGKVIYGFDQLFADDVSDTGTNSAPYEIDENGYIKSLEGDGDYQYYNVVSVEDGVIGTIQNDQGVESVADDGVNQVDQWFFTTRAAAEAYYYSKVNPKNWMWFDHYPWVYSEEEGDWLYFYPSGGILRYWSNKGQAWRQFN